MSAIVLEMGTAAPLKNASHYRKITVAFRDQHLLASFQFALDTVLESMVMCLCVSCLCVHHHMFDFDVSHRRDTP